MIIIYNPMKKMPECQVRIFILSLFSFVIRKMYPIRNKVTLSYFGVGQLFTCNIHLTHNKFSLISITNECKPQTPFRISYLLNIRAVPF
jgi:hypothetical protein